MSRPTTTANQSGFTLLEVMLTATLLGGAMAMIATCIETATKSLAGDDLVARSMEALQRSAVRVSQILRPCSLTTYQVQAIAADVPTNAAAVGDWCEPPDDSTARHAVKFQAADGQLSLNAATLTTPRILRLELESGETANGNDDDGDGMIDESYVVLDYGGVTARLASNVESMSFTLTGRVLEIELGAAARRKDGNVQRFKAHETLFLRNN